MAKHKRKAFCVETYKSDPLGRQTGVKRSCGLTFKQAESAARRALTVRDTRTSHVVAESGRHAMICYRGRTLAGRKPHVECRRTFQSRQASYRLSEMVRGAPELYVGGIK